MSDAKKRAIDKGFEFWDSRLENEPVVAELVSIGWDEAKAHQLGAARELSEWIFEHYPTPESDVAVAAFDLLKRLHAEKGGEMTTDKREYTPTTDEVREDFAYPWSPDQIGDRDVRQAAFDRWLAEHDAQVLDLAASAWETESHPLSGSRAARFLRALAETLREASR